ncbi:hypothetical protein [Hartmannibacter diazotrophicus]|uniref:hypothetical protein n=1 Tax=Hartmannibacter diazotrophicus TaxID=1482074 RepID=UPI000C1479D8|nr:hypothetical protein [Hartmannibacter diazotrophicus]
MISKIDAKTLVLAVVASFIFVFALNAIYAPMLNNGDYWRVVGAFNVDAVTWRPLPACIAVNDSVGWSELLPASTMRTILAAIFIGFRFAGEPCLTPNGIFIGLSAIYFLGVVLIAAVGTIGLGARIGTILGLCFAYSFVGFYMKSGYEAASVLAFLPLFTFAAMVRSRIVYLLASAAILYSKAQMIFLVPFMIYAYVRCVRLPLPRKWMDAAVILVFLVAPSAVQLYKASQYGLTEPNAYNRVYNGFGWTLQGVADWPVHEFRSRKGYFDEHKAELQARTEFKSLFPDSKLAGTSYWPTGAAIRDDAGEEDVPALDKSRLRESFIALATNGPSHLHWVRTALELAYTSDYSLDYTRSLSPLAKSGPLSYESVSAAILANLGFVFLAFAVLTVLIARRFDLLLLAGYIAAGAPMFTVTGDGFFEYEKHLLPVMIFVFALPGIAVACRSVALGRRG